MKIFYQIVLLLLFAPPFLSGQQKFTVKSAFYGVKEGLSDRDVKCLLTDRQGFLWIGTKKGLNRFDGYRFKLYNHENAGLPFDDIVDIYEDDEGWLWLIGEYQEHNVILFNPTDGKVRTLADRFGTALPLSDQYFYKSAHTADGAIWFGNLDLNSIIRYHSPEGFTLFSHPGHRLILECSADSVNVCINYDGNIMVLHPDGKMIHQNLIPPNVLNHSLGISFYPYRNGILRVVGEKNFYAFDPHSLLPPVDEKTLPDDALTDFYVLSKELIADSWALKLTTGGTLFQFGPLLANGAKVVLPIDENTFWIGGHNGILLLTIRPILFTEILKENPELNTGNRSCRGIWTDGNELYVNMDEYGLYHYNLKSKKTEHLFNEGYWGHFGLLHDDPFLYGGLRNGLFRIDLNSHKTVNWHESAPILCMYRLYVNTMLCGTEDSGLLIFDTQLGSFQHFNGYNQFHELERSEIDFIGEDLQHNIWICADSGFYSFSIQKGITGRKWKEDSGADIIPALGFRHFLQDRKGLFWLATKGSGLFLWDPEKGTTRVINRTDGLSSDETYAVYEGGENQIWVPTDFGIDQIDKSSLHIKVWTMDDGISYNEFNTLSHFQDASGRLYFGGLNGITTFDPAQFQSDEKKKNESLRLCNVQIFNSNQRKWHDEPINTEKEIQINLSKNENLLRADFSLLDFDDIDDIQYSWQMQGLDTTWNVIDKPTLQISRPPFGDYILHIRAITAHGNWSENTLNVALNVVPPFYLKLWFRTLCIILLVFMIIQYGRWRIAKQKKEALRLEREIIRQTSTISEQAEALREMDEIKSRYFANFSHELRTPLTLLLGPISSVLKKNKVDPADQNLLHIAKDNAQQLLKKVGDILDLGKLESGHLTLDEKECNPGRIFSNLCFGFKSHAERLGILFVVKQEIYVHRIIMLDEKKWSVIITNLLSNAFKFTPARGKVIALLREVDGQLVMSISDTGRGIHEKDIEHIFDRYYQSSIRDAPIAGGTGIGLALCKEYTQLMLGQITVNQVAPSGGANFQVTIPIKEVTIRAENQDEEINTDDDSNINLDVAEIIKKEINTGQHSVLIVEDNESLRTYLKNILEPEFIIHVTTNGREAIDYLLNSDKEMYPSLILSDIMMPFIDGLQLAEMLKNNDSFRHIPLVMLTARADMKDKLKALRIGVDDYLLKPFEEDELLARIRNLLSSSSQRFRKENLDQDIDAPDMDKLTYSAEDQLWLLQLESLTMQKMANFNLSAEMLATNLGMSRATLFRRVKQLTGLTAQQYVTEVRFQVAREWLESRRYSSVKAIALSVGLKDVEHFSRQFREKFGKLPSSYLN